MRDFTRGSVPTQILLFSVPMLIGNLFQQAYSMADAVVVGRFVSGDALAAVGVSMNLLQFLLSVLIGLTTGASVVISQFYGAGQHQKVKQTVSTSIIFLSAFSLLIAVLGVFFSRTMLRLLGTAPEIMDDAAIYMQVLMAGMVFSTFFNMYTAYLRALGDSRGPLYILICCTLLNIGLDLLFIVSFKMGVMGAAVATIISQALSAVLCYIYARKRAPLLNPDKLSFDRPLFAAILKYGTPAALQLSLVSLANLAITSLINSFGSSAMAGITAASKIDQLAIMPVSNIAMALSTFVGQNMGAGQGKRAKNGLHWAMIFMLVLAVLMSGLLLALGPRFISMFLNEGDVNSAEIVTLGLKYMNIMVVFYFLFAFLFAFNGFFRGAGDAMSAMAFPVISLALRTASAYLLVNLAGMGPEALAWSIPIGWGLSSIASFFYYKKGLWKGKLIVKEERAAES